MAVDAVGSTYARHRRGYYLYLVPGTIGFLLIVLIPQIANFFLSFTAWKGVGTPRWIGIQNYQRLLADDQFWGSMIHTVLFIISMTIIPVAIGVVLASLLFDYIRDQFGERVSNLFRAGFYPDWPVPGYYDVLNQKDTGLFQGTLTPQQFVDQIKKVYDDAQASQ